jgi:hypothetical protein
MFILNLNVATRHFCIKTNGTDTSKGKMFATLQDVGDNKLGKPVPSKKHDMHHPFIMDVSPEHLEHLPPKQTDILHGMAFSELPRCVPFRNKLPALQNLEGQNYSQKM